MLKHKYAIQRRYQTEVAKKVGGALDRIFEYINGKSLHVNETISIIESPKPITKKKRDELCAYLLDKAKQDGDKETLAFECVPYSESIEARAGEDKHARNKE